MTEACCKPPKNFEFQNDCISIYSTTQLGFGGNSYTSFDVDMYHQKILELYSSASIPAYLE
jgi:hypothetical protein